MFSASHVSMNLHFALDISPPRALGLRPAGYQPWGGECANTHPNKKRVKGLLALVRSHHIICGNVPACIILSSAVNLQRINEEKH